MPSPFLLRLKQVLSYAPTTGVFRWRSALNSRALPGRIAGSAYSRGARIIRIDGRRYLAHRLAWLYVHGEWPADEIDHRNGNPDDNRIANLRDASCRQNSQNRKLPRNNSSGFKGVSWHKKRRRWVATIMCNGRARALGRFLRKEDAAAAYDTAATELFKDFKRT